MLFRSDSEYTYDRTFTVMYQCWFVHFKLGMSIAPTYVTAMLIIYCNIDFWWSILIPLLIFFKRRTYVYYYTEYQFWYFIRGIYISVQIRFSFSQNSGKKPKKKISEIIIFLFSKIFSYNYKISVKHKKPHIFLKASKYRFFLKIQLNSEFSYR